MSVRPSFVKSIIFLFLDIVLQHMELENDAQISKFLLLGFSEEPELQSLIFVIFLSMYLITVFGNLLIILAVSSDPHLHTLRTSSSPACPLQTSVSSRPPSKICSGTSRQNKGITYEGYISQMFFPALHRAG